MNVAKTLLASITLDAGAVARSGTDQDAQSTYGIT